MAVLPEKRGCQKIVKADQEVSLANILQNRSQILCFSSYSQFLVLSKKCCTNKAPGGMMPGRVTVSTLNEPGWIFYNPL